MENILPYLPLVMCSSSNKRCYQWPPEAEKLLKNFRVDSADDLISALSSLRIALNLSSRPLSKPMSRGFKHFFDKSMSSEESSKWFNKVLPTLAKLLLKLPSLLESHCKIATMGAEFTTALRVFEPQQPGVVCLSKELIAALLGCSLFCLFPTKERRVKNLPMINFDKFFNSKVMGNYEYHDYENKIWCILHYFERISSDMPKGIVSFERRVHSSDANLWRNSAIPLCKFEVHTSGQIKDQSGKAVEVYLVTRKFMQRVLCDGTSEVHRRFMFSPELIACMFFLPTMKDNEAIEIVGVERFSTNARYWSSFRFSDAYKDKTNVDNLGRRKTRIVFVNVSASDSRESTVDILLSDINKSFCALMHYGIAQGNNIGVATAEWFFLNYTESILECLIMWLAASQAQRPFIAFDLKMPDSENLHDLICWISSKSWTVAFLYNVVIEYFTTNRSKGDDFFEWLQLSYGHTCKNLDEENPSAACDVCERERVLARMENFLKFLPVKRYSLSVRWPPKTVKILKKCEERLIQSGKELLKVSVSLRRSLAVTVCHSDGFANIFDSIMYTEESRKWFVEVVPAFSKLLLNLPSLLEAHYKNANMDIFGEGAMVPTALRILKSQTPGIVCLSQELIAALLGCSLFCIFPTYDRNAENLPTVNFDKLFDLFRIKRGSLREHQLNKIWCILHYFQRICSDMPKGIVSFQRKVLPSNLEFDFWSNSTTPLCKFKVHTSGLIEDQSSEAVEVYFADKNFGGKVLGTGTSQEEIRFMLSPELIAGMLFLPAMEDNEAIEIVGVERFSTYAGFKASFRFSGTHVDKTEVDTLGRRKTRIVALKALCTPTMREYTAEFFLREINKAFCGFMCDGMDHGNIGVATGDRVFGKDPEMKAIIQWLAASQAQRPFIAYCTFGLEALQNLDKVAHWISIQGWTVGFLWNKLIEYSAGASTETGFFRWLQLSCGHGDKMDLTNQSIERVGGRSTKKKGKKGGLGRIHQKKKVWGGSPKERRSLAVDDANKVFQDESQVFIRVFSPR